MAAPQSPIVDRQNTPEVLTLIRAMSAAHARIQRLEGSRLIVSALVALTSILAAVVPSLAATVAAVGAGWALLQGWGFSVWIQRELAQAALMQELLDVTLFEIGWNSVAAGDPPSPAEISSLAQRFRGAEELVVDYYEIRDFVDLPRPFDVLACQMQNLHWGARIRRRFASTVLVVLIGWPLAGTLVGVLLQVPLGRLLLIWFLPALGALLVSSELYRRQRDTAAVRGRVLALVRRRVNADLERPGPIADLLILARQVQDVMLATRRSQARVPDWFFLRFRRRDRIDFQREVAELARAVSVAQRRMTPPEQPSP